MLTAKQVAKRLQTSVSWVYAHKWALGAFQLSAGGAVRFPEQRITEMIANAVPNGQWEVEGDQDDKRSPKAKSMPDKSRSEKMGITTDRRAMATADPYGLRN